MAWDTHSGVRGNSIPNTNPSYDAVSTNSCQMTSHHAASVSSYVVILAAAILLL